MPVQPYKVVRAQHIGWGSSPADSVFQLDEIHCLAAGNLFSASEHFKAPSRNSDTATSL